MHRGYEAIALEVSAVKGKKALHCVHAHDGDEPCVIDFDALDLVIVQYASELTAFIHGFTADRILGGFTL